MKPKIYTLFAVLLLCIGANLNAQCTVSFTYSTNGLSISATATGVGVAAVPVFGFDWGDATQPSLSQTDSHIYIASGTYTVCAVYLDLLDTANCNATSCQQVTLPAVGISDPSAQMSVSSSPNPFSTTTVIALTTNGAMNAEISVYDLMGKKIGTILNDQLGAGSHFTTWDATEFASGVYAIRVKVGDQVQTLKVVKQ